MNKKMMYEIGMSTGLVLLMIALILGVQLAFPEDIRSAGFAVTVLLFMVAMGLAGVKLMDM